MLTNQTAAASQNLTDKPERIGPALAQVIHVDAERDVILGQAWLAAANQLITCGHVVERFAADSGLFVYFPSSGKRYPVQSIKMHPSYVRQPDGLVKFDAACLSVQLTAPESLALPLPFNFEQSLRVNEPLWTIRYPVHLGQFSAATQPLAQEGRYLGLLRKHDSFHLLHDVPLSPGDSGAPITDGKVVVAMHCGDTATLPGLNLPTTSIRLALWVDALRDLGLAPTRKVYGRRKQQALPLLLGFIFAVVAGFSVALPWLKAPPPAAKAMPPVEVKFNKPLDSFASGNPVDITITPGVRSYVFVFMLSANEGLMKLWPQKRSQIVEAQDGIVVDRFLFSKDQPSLSASRKDLTFVVVDADAGDAQTAKWAEELWPDPSTLKIPYFLDVQQMQRFLDGLKGFESLHPASVICRRFNLKGVPAAATAGKPAD